MSDQQFSIDLSRFHANKLSILAACFIAASRIYARYVPGLNARHAYMAHASRTTTALQSGNSEVYTALAAMPEAKPSIDPMTDVDQADCEVLCSYISETLDGRCELHTES
jgi:hypothetical protein